MQRDGTWIKSSRSQFDGNCLQVAAGLCTVAVRNSRDPDGPVLRMPPSEWRDFVDSVKAGEMGGD